MTSPDPSLPVLDSDRSGLDGRRARGRSSRTKIVAAMLDLVASGKVAPSAAEVADTAGVGLRSVFRHFTDMDALYREMTEAVEQRVTPMLAEPLEGATWQARLHAFAARRAKIFEAILPFRISANVRRFESAFLMADYHRLQQQEADMLASFLPPEVRADAEGVRGLNVILGFSTWRQLRHDHGLSPEAAAGVVRRMLADALAHWPDA